MTKNNSEESLRDLSVLDKEEKKDEISLADDEFFDAEQDLKSIFLKYKPTKYGKEFYKEELYTFCNIMDDVMYNELKEIQAIVDKEQLFQNFLKKNIIFMFMIFRVEISNNITKFSEWFFEQKKQNFRFNSIYGLVTRREIRITLQEVIKLEDEELIYSEFENRIEMKFESAMS